MTIQDFIFFDFTNLTFSKIFAKDGPPKSYAHKAVVYENSMYVYGGYDYDKTYYTDLYCFDFKKMNWKTIKTTGRSPGNRLYHQMCIINDELFLYGGLNNYDYSSICSDLYLFDIPKNNWKLIETQNSISRSYTSMIPISKSKLFLFGGWNGYSNEKGSFIYNIPLQKWISVENIDDFPGERFSMSIALYQNDIFIFGGKNLRIGYNGIFKCNFQMDDYKFNLLKINLQMNFNDMKFLFNIY